MAAAWSPGSATSVPSRPEWRGNIEPGCGERTSWSKLADVVLADPARPLDEIAFREDDVAVIVLGGPDLPQVIVLAVAGVGDEDVLLPLAAGVVQERVPPGV